MCERAERSHPTSRILQVLYILFFLALSVEGDKSQANITIANIVRYNGIGSNLGLVVWNDVGAQLAVDLINKSPDILPNATIIIKRFNDLDPDYSHGGSGLTSALYSKFQIPHCTSVISAPDFNNPSNRPYYFSLLPNTGSGTALCILLKQWNVKRVALITDSGSPDLVSSFNECNIRIITLSTVADSTSIPEIINIGALIKHYDLRYIVLDAGSHTSGLVYFTFAAGNPAVSYYDSLLQMFVDNANTYTKPLGTLDPLGGLVHLTALEFWQVESLHYGTDIPEIRVSTEGAEFDELHDFADSKYRGFSGDPIKLHSEYGYVILFFEVSGLLVCGIDILVTLCFKHTKAVRSQIPSFNFITVIGAILGYSSSFLQFGRPTIGNCIGNAWLLSLCFVMVSASISLKNAKLGLIYNAKTKLPKIYMQETIWILLVSGFVIIDAIFLSIWTWKANIYPHNEYILIAYYVILGILCSYSAYMARNVTGIHSNSSYTFIIVLSTAIFLTIGELISSSSSSTISKIFEMDMTVTIKLLLKHKSSVRASITGIYSSKIQAPSRQQSSARIKSKNNNEVVDIKSKRKASEAVGSLQRKILVKGVKVVFNDNRYWSEWVTAICVVTKIGNGRIKAFRLAETDCPYCSGPIPEISIDFTAVEKAEGFMSEIAKYKKELQ
ncbi:hypothetical protein BCR33DRAFT_718975 [Rhizoclosmatium globosum]|uniref:G-protein coupled receptors family 3 profile domain-containing protein n=1 Tax=Rhizoclosmatium globosum TaxID=329046 RepID=A0A1Y2C2V6_9FUNG|nr:hypothetical protein BCR33DRAFT_718975 [Rhizoclosmatium globosum]|eukprot:ORY41368.1 hypothetical protein BCR33DRAFT_718975 [Rhizoclosmatium globosum]